MKIAILGHSKPGYICPMMKGLARMLGELDCEVDVCSHGINFLSESPGLKGRFKSAWFRSYMERLADCDAVVVVQHLGEAFRTSLKVESLRTVLPDMPIILYDLVYLPTIGRWGPWLVQGEGPLWGADGGTHYGMGRYDWYLCVSTSNRCPMPAGEQPCSGIGLHLDDGSLFPEQGGRFTALVDFARDAFSDERRVQLEALQETGTQYAVLDGQYSIADIRSIYRSSSLYFIAHMESFGLPICELQACGSYIITPYADWCDAHKINGELPANFIVYENDKQRLIETIRTLREHADPSVVVERFLSEHRHFMTGNLAALQGFLDRIGRGQITGRSHLGYEELTAQIQLRPGN